MLIVYEMNFLRPARLYLKKYFGFLFFYGRRMFYLILYGI